MRSWSPDRLGGRAILLFHRTRDESPLTETAAYDGSGPAWASAWGLSKRRWSLSITIVNDYFFKPDGDVAGGKAAAAELVEYFRTVPEIQLSLWLESQENPLHHYHITVFDSEASVKAVKESDAIKRFVERLFPHIDHGTYVSPVCDVWLADGHGVQAVADG